jgi:hypothetical protein
MYSLLAIIPLSDILKLQVSRRFPPKAIILIHREFATSDFDRVAYQVRNPVFAGGIKGLVYVGRARLVGGWKQARHKKPGSPAQASRV